MSEQKPAPKPTPVIADPKAAAAAAKLRKEIHRALGSIKWSAASKKVLQQVDTHLAQGQEDPAFMLLRALPEAERKAFTEEVARGAYKLFAGYTRPAAVAVWIYLHFGGADRADLPTAQGHMIVPKTGKLDAATLAAVRRLTGQEIWPKVIS